MFELKGTVIEVEAFGDYDVKYTVCIMIHPDELELKEILEEFYEIQGIYSNTGLTHNQLRNVTKDYIAFLELKGFKKLKTQPVYFCD